MRAIYTRSIGDVWETWEVDDAGELSLARILGELVDRVPIKPETQAEESDRLGGLNGSLSSSEE